LIYNTIPYNERIILICFYGKNPKRIFLRRFAQPNKK